jgi:hypothetical protein
LPEAGVDHLEAGVAESAGDYLSAAIMPVETGLGDQYAQSFIHQNMGSSYVP